MSVKGSGQQGSALSVFSSTNALLPSGHQVSTHNSCLLEQSISPQKTLNDVGERKPPPPPPPPLPYATCAVMLRREGSPVRLGRAARSLSLLSSDHNVRESRGRSALLIHTHFSSGSEHIGKLNRVYVALEMRRVRSEERWRSFI
ncbi:unnamed protein product [Leuciscus chuanchicus]